MPSLKPLKSIPLPKLSKNPSVKEKELYKSSLKKYKEQGYGYTYEQKGKNGKTVDVIVVVEDIVPPPPPTFKKEGIKTKTSVPVKKKIKKAKMEDGSIREFEIIETPAKIPLKLDSKNKEVTKIIKTIPPVTKIQGEYLDKYATYRKNLKAYSKGADISSKDLVIKYNELLEIYNSFTKEDKEIFHSFQASPPLSKN